MKLLLTLLPALLTQTTGRRNQRIVIGFLLFTAVLVALFSIVFHQIMAYEGRDYSYITGVYWTLTVIVHAGVRGTSPSRATSGNCSPSSCWCRVSSSS